MSKGQGIRRKIYIILRLVLLLSLLVVLARFINSKNYAYYANKTLLKIHTDLKTPVTTRFLPEIIASLLSQNQTKSLQDELDKNYSIFAMVITDCRSVSYVCSDQKILFATSAHLLQKKLPRPEELINYPYILLRLSSQKVEGDGKPAQSVIIGRLYTISTIPGSFEEDYREWLKDPFADYGPWKYYLSTMIYCLLGGVLVWTIMELFLKLRWIEQRNASERERLLITNADNYLRQLEDKGNQIAEQERSSSRQFEAFILRIKELEGKLQHDKEQRSLAEAIIRSLENEQQQQQVKLREELEKTNQEKLALRAEVANYQRASGKEKAEASRTLSNAIKPQFTNVFEQKVFDAVIKTAKSQSGTWLVLSHFDVAVGKAGSQFIDSIVISKDCMMVIEAKNYSGIIISEGDVENTRWQSMIGGRTDAEVKSSWGMNPYHQVREYTMSLLTMVNTRGRWNLPVYGVIVFPEGTDISGIGERIGRFYRVTTSDRLIGVLENIDSEARRDNAHSKRPTPRQIEDVILGRNIDLKNR
jgi:hypothetical protein